MADIGEALLPVGRLKGESVQIKSVAIKGFRGAKDRIELNIDPDFTILAGQNDAGKSTFLNALRIFFDRSKLVDDDYNMSLDGRSDSAYIEVAFGKLPSGVVLDATHDTSFASEYLTNEDGLLVVRHTYSGGKISKSLLAKHPVVKEDGRSLLAMKQNELKTFASKNSIDLTDCNKAVNAEIRAKIYQSSELFTTVDEFELEESLPEFKSFFSKLEKNYPVFHLFSAENVSDEGEKYVQDPVKAIVKQVIEQHKSELERVAEQIDRELKSALLEVSYELGRLAPTLKTSFSPHNIEAKWDNAYRAVAFHDENNVPLATRGSGMRRLALLSFFRVSARGKSDAQPVVFAVEEPEAFLHPDLQLEVWDALTDLAVQEDSQVLITSHSSNLIARTDVEQVRYLSNGLVEEVSREEDEAKIYDFVVKIEKSLGKFRDSNVECFLLVEGKNDIATIEGIAKFFTEDDREATLSTPELVEFGKHLNTGRILLLPIGGTGSVGLWKTGRLDSFSKPVVFLADRDDNDVVLYSQEELTEKMKRSEFFTVYHSRREMENLLSIDLIVDNLVNAWNVDEATLREGLVKNGLDPANMDDCDVPVACARAYFYAMRDEVQTEVTDKQLDKKESAVKKILARAYKDLDRESAEQILDSNFGTLVAAINSALRHHHDEFEDSRQ